MIAIMAESRAWLQGARFWRSLPASSYTMLLAGIFCMFLPVGLLNDISILGGTPLPRLLGEVAFSGAIAVVYVLVARWPRWLPFLIGGHVVVSIFLFGGQTPRSHDLTAAHARLVAD